MSMRLPIVLHRAHFDGIGARLATLDFQSWALFAFSATARRHAILESRAAAPFSGLLAVARGHLDVLEESVVTARVDRSSELWSLAPRDFETGLGRGSVQGAIARLYELVFLLREAVADERRGFMSAVPWLALDCIYAQVTCSSEELTPEMASFCGAHAEALKEERAQVEDLDSILHHRGDRGALVMELTGRAQGWPSAHGGCHIECAPELCGTAM